MARELQPCGTFAAYQRHKRKGEEPCEECAASARDQKNSRTGEKRSRSGAARLAAVPSIKQPEHDIPDPLEVARENLGFVEGALRSPETAASSVASLTRRREELVNLIIKLSAPKIEEVSAIDKFAARFASGVSAAQD